MCPQSDIAPPLCQCGCGQSIKIARRENGRPRSEQPRFVQGHHRVLRHIPPSKYTVDSETGCWRFKGKIVWTGYGIIKHLGKEMPAHRWAYEIANGPIPEGFDLDHVRERGCRYRDCINPDHLEPVTKAENIRRSPATKLTMEKARAIRAMRGLEPLADTAERCGVSRSLISLVQRGEMWRE